MPSIKDIAVAAGVSRCAASQILNRARGHERFSPNIRQRVESIAAQHGWARDYRAWSLRTGRTGTIALGLRWGGVKGTEAAILAAVERAASQHDQRLVVVNGGGVRAAQMVHERYCDAALAVGWNVKQADEEALRNLPHAILYSVPPGLRGVGLDVSAGLSAAIDHLAGLGHHRLAWVQPDNADGDHRREAAQRLCRQRGLDLLATAFAWPADDRSDEEQIMAAKAGIVRSRQALRDRTALLCYNDNTAIGAYAAAAEMDLRIARDWSVIGFDDVQAAFAVPGLTAISHEWHAVAEAGLGMLMGKGPRRGQMIKPHLVIRASTGRAPR